MMHRFLAALALVLAPVVAAAQVPNFPQTVPANTVIGRIGIGDGPTQAIPFATLSAQLNAGGVTGPATTTVGHFATWANSVGTLLADTSAVNLASQVVGNLPTTNLNGGSGASSSTFWRGDGTWATPATSPAGSSGQVQYNNASSFGAADIWVADANTIEHYNTTNPQVLRIYNTRTDASNYERLTLSWASNVISIQPENAGTGSARSMLLNAPSGQNLYLANSGAAAAVVTGSRLEIQNNKVFATVSGGVTLANGLNSNVNMTSSYIRITGPSGAFSLGGIVAQTDGVIMRVFNTTAQAMTIVNEDVSSTAANRITTLTGANVVLRTGTSFANFIYDTGNSRWILTGTN